MLVPSLVDVISLEFDKFMIKTMPTTAMDKFWSKKLSWTNKENLRQKCYNVGIIMHSKVGDQTDPFQSNEITCSHKLLTVYRPKASRPLLRSLMKVLGFPLLNNSSINSGVKTLGSFPFWIMLNAEIYTSI